MGKILVIGSLNIDMVMKVDHMPTVGETILCDGMKLVAGGKGANQACAAGRLGTDVTMLGAIGNDSHGEMQRDSLQRSGVDVSGLITKERVSTGTAFITVNKEGNNSIVVVQGANAQFTPEDIEAHRDLLEECEIVILQLEIPMDTVLYAVKLARTLGKTVILDPAPVPEHFPEELYQYVDIIKPNESELSRLTGIADAQNHLEEAVQIVKDHGVKNVLVTLGGDGVYLDTENEPPVHIPAKKVEVVDTTAAGDSFTAALAAMLLEGKTLKEAAEFANQVSAIVVTREGAQDSIPTLQEVLTK
ncbi:Ribokinase [uncultured Clostridium sp.]|uniref:Ribokinase n=1 Tax=Muricoprocola aceti TaxID=2981772 RepID=A0ABT2SMH9_9FIRM|nr:ribokinase [Muricoprocola aceti]MCU6725283.1 ribokinase [Muricoprocola aceti]SCH45384.1 Ribokinase [uncultured Clostridium sp.]